MCNLLGIMTCPDRLKCMEILDHCVSYASYALIQCHLASRRLSYRDLKGVISQATEKATHKTASAWSEIKKDPQTD